MTEFCALTRQELAIVLVANKVDRRTSGVDTVSKEEVSLVSCVRIIMLNNESRQGEEAAKTIGADYAETSAKTGDGVRRLFYRAIIRSVPIDIKSHRRRSGGRVPF